MDQFVFLKNDEIGAAAAEDDLNFLTKCFVDNGDFAALHDVDNPKRIVVGRTGAGKSALIAELMSKEPNSIQISLESLSLNFIANNNVISFFEEAGVSLAPFYGLLWRHVLVVELLKKKFNINSEESQKKYIKQIRRMFVNKDKNKEMAIDYLEKWGDKFWLTTEERIHDITENINTKLSGSVDLNSFGVPINASGARQLNKEDKYTIVERGRRAVSDIQIRELENIIGLMADDIFNDKQNKFFIAVDGLDEPWVDDRIKLSLIRSLIDTVRKFKKITTVKVVVALRDDLLDKVVHHSRDPGFQEEKYKSLYLDVKWTESELKEIVDKRISELVKRRYTNKKVGFEDVFADSINGDSTIRYLTSRTFMRPRDIIIFVNECIKESAKESIIKPSSIKTAEQRYSYERLKSLATEWLGIYPDLFSVTRMFEGQKNKIKVSELNESFFQEKYVSVCDDFMPNSTCPLVRLLNGMYQSDGNFGSARSSFLKELYITGFIGLKLTTSSPVMWSHLSGYGVSVSQIKANSDFYIHPAFHRALSINCS